MFEYVFISHTLRPAYTFLSASCSPFRLGVARYAFVGTASNPLYINA